MDSTYVETRSTKGNVGREGILRVFWLEDAFHKFHQYDEECYTICNCLTIEKRKNNSISLYKCIIFRIFFIYRYYSKLSDTNLYIGGNCGKEISLFFLP